MATTYLWVNGNLVAVGGDGAWSTDPSSFYDWSPASIETGLADAPAADATAPQAAPAAARLATSADTLTMQAAPAVSQDSGPTIFYVNTAAQLSAAIIAADGGDPYGSYVIELGTA